VVNGTFVERAAFFAEKFPDLPLARDDGGPPLTMIKIVLIVSISFASPSQ
jgi:hypothetical protein